MGAVASLCIVCPSEVLSQHDVLINVEICTIIGFDCCQCWKHSDSLTKITSHEGQENVQCFTRNSWEFCLDTSPEFSQSLNETAGFSHRTVQPVYLADARGDDSVGPTVTARDCESNHILSWALSGGRGNIVLICPGTCSDVRQLFSSLLLQTDQGGFAKLMYLPGKPDVR